MVPESMEETAIETLKNTSLQKLTKVDTASNLEIKKDNDSIAAISKISAGYDLLILGTPQKGNWISVLFGTGKDKYTEKSACSVLRLTMKDH